MVAAASPLSVDFTRQLEQLVGSQHVHRGPAERIAYSFDATFQQQVPELVVSPASTGEVAAVVALCAGHAVPIVPRGAGSGLAGGTIPTRGALVLNLARMHRVLAIDPADGVAVAEAGVVTADLQSQVERLGLFYPPDPASLNQCSLGGNVATNAGGPRCLKYGATRDYVRGLTVVLADGRVLRTGGRLLKQSTGYQLTQLFVGSEGTLGVITEVIVRLLPLPRCRSTAVALFPSLETAAEAVTAVFTSGLLPVTLEMMDHTTINVVEDYLHMGLPRQAEALLILEQDGNDEALAAQEVERMGRVCRQAGATEV
ncbi:MAG: FAD-binding protein, partial [Chloroflexi bacterium]|nr:FAD-binding protein [Chloroflexota bacterium]